MHSPASRNDLTPHTGQNLKANMRSTCTRHPNARLARGGGGGVHAVFCSARGVMAAIQNLILRRQTASGASLDICLARERATRGPSSQVDLKEREPLSWSTPVDRAMMLARARATPT